MNRTWYKRKCFRKGVDKVMYKTEAHLHVSEVSPCSKLKATEMISLYHDAGYKTVFFRKAVC